jgi:hypothetical protein
MLVVNEYLEPLAVDSKVGHPSSSFFRTFYSNGFSGCCLAFHRDVLQIILPFPERLPMHDWWIALIVILFNKKININEEKLILYRRHSSNASKTSINSDFSFIKKFYMRILLLFFLFQRCINIFLNKYKK